MRKKVSFEETKSLSSRSLIGHACFFFGGGVIHCPNRHLHLILEKRALLSRWFLSKQCFLDLVVNPWQTFHRLRIRTISSWGLSRVWFNVGCCWWWCRKGFLRWCSLYFKLVVFYPFKPKIYLKNIYVGAWKACLLTEFCNALLKWEEMRVLSKAFLSSLKKDSNLFPPRKIK